MAMICSRCGSADTVTEMRGWRCLVAGCQHLTTYAEAAETPQPTHRREEADAEETP